MSRAPEEGAPPAGASADFSGLPVDDDSEYSDDGSLDLDTLHRDETMNALMVQCEGALQEVEAVGEWYEDCVRRATEYLRAENPDDIDEVESLSQVRSGDLMHRDGSIVSTSSEEWAVEAILQRKAFKGQPYYLVRWRGYAAPSWELEDDLVSYGYAGWLETFLNDAAAHGHRTPVPPQVKMMAPSYAPDAPLPKPRPGEFSPERLWPDFKDRISHAFQRWSTEACISRIQNVVHPTLSQRFMQRWLSAGDRALAPLMVFHCTEERNVPGIVANGLVVPGTSGPGVRVLNGSAYGIGIYTSKDIPFTGYCRGGNYAFVCAGLIGKKYTSAKEHPGLVVFCDAELVLPCFLVEWHLQLHCYHIPTYVTDLYRPTALWPPPCPRPYMSHEVNPVRYSTRHLPKPLPRQPGSNASQWADHARSKPISKKQLKQCARRVKALYKEGALKQTRSTH